MKARYVNVYKLMEFANNMKDKSIDANDIARFQWADVRENVHAHWEDSFQAGIWNTIGQEDALIAFMRGMMITKKRIPHSVLTVVQ